MPEDDKATDATSSWSMISLLKGIWDKLNSGVAVTGAQTDDAAFTVGTTKVTTNASTKFEDVTCATLANGMAVEAKGTRQSDGSILATEVERELDEVEGTVSALSGTCPTLTFNVGTRKTPCSTM